MFNDPTIVSTVKQQLKSDMLFASGLTSAAFGQLKTLAVLRDDLFDEVGRLFTNPPVYKGFQQPTAMTHFVRVGGIPPDDLLNLLRKISTDKLTMKQFMESCETFKARSRIMVMFLESLDITTMEEFRKARHVNDQHVRSINTVSNSYAGQIT